MRPVYLLIFAFLVSIRGFGQSLEDYNRRMYNYNKGDWIAVGGWSVVGIGVSTYGIINSKNLQNKHFHQMNVIANAANMVFVVPGLISSFKKDPTTFDEKETWRHNIRHEHTYLFNVGLDIFYTTLGLRLRQLGQINTNNTEILTGFGNSLIIQGGFLFCSDLTMTILHITHRKHGFDRNVEFTTGANGIGFKWKL